MKGFSLIIPAHDSGKFIEGSLRKYNEIFSPKFKNFEIIVICNYCRDNTLEVCNLLKKELPLKVIEIPQRGKGYALIKGFDNAKFEYMGFLDADNPFDLQKILKMLGRLGEYDAVIASKYLRGKAHHHDSFLRRLISLGGSTVSRILFDLKFRDTQAGAKFFKQAVWKKISAGFSCTGFDFDIEFLYKIHKDKFKILEVYIPFKYEKFSTFRLKYLPGMLKRLIILRFLK